MNKLPVDAELDVAVAEKVMGWHVHHRNTAHWCDSDELDYKVRGWVEDWSPSTDIADAWEVVLFVSDKTGWYDLWRSAKTKASATFGACGSREAMAVVSLDETDGDRTKAQCLAICQAALRTVEE